MSYSTTKHSLPKALMTHKGKKQVRLSVIASLFTVGALDVAVAAATTRIVEMVVVLRVVEVEK